MTCPRCAARDALARIELFAEPATAERLELARGALEAIATTPRPLCLAHVRELVSSPTAREKERAR